MVELATLRRVLYGHQWRDADEWAEAIRTLANLSETDLAALLGECTGSALVRPAAVRPRTSVPSLNGPGSGRR
jgi:hypothetical protein